jgi:hypothetical protein
MGWLRQLVVALVMLSVVARADAQALPAFSGAVNKAVAKVVEKTAARRGFAANDPRYTATLAAMSGEAATVAGVVTAAAVAGSAPVWVTVAAGLGAAAIVGGLVFGAMKLFFDDSSSAAMFTVQKPGTQGAAMPNVTASKGWQDVGQGLVSGPVGGRTVYMSGSAAGLNTDDPAVANKFDSNLHFVRSNEKYAMQPVYALGLWWTALIGSNNGEPAMIPMLWEAYVASQGGTVTSKPPCTQSGTSWTCTIKYRYPWTGTADAQASVEIPVVPNPYHSAPGEVLKGSVSDIVPQLPQTELAKDADPGTVAVIANNLWQRAASQPDYKGLPYSASDPVTAADAAAARDADPANWPKNADLVSPVASAANQPVPIGEAVTSPTTPTEPAPGTGTQNVNVVNTPNVRIDGAVDVNWGDAPTVHDPTLNTPTAQQILSPITSLMSGLRSYVVPAHSSVCPTPSFTVLDHTFVIDSHCELAESARPTLFPVMAAVWAVLAALIVLRA